MNMPYLTRFVMQGQPFLRIGVCIIPRRLLVALLLLTLFLLSKAVAASGLLA